MCPEWSVHQTGSTPLLQRADHLNEHDQSRLDQLFATHPRLRAGWDALQELYGLRADDRDGALQALDRFTDSTPPANSASSTTSSTPSSRGATRSSPGMTPAGPPTAESKEPTTSSKSYAASPTASPTPTTSPPADSS